MESHRVKLRSRICVDQTQDDAVWNPSLHWQDTDVWDATFPNQDQVLVVDFQFGVRGEFRRIDPNEDFAPLVLVPKGSGENSAIIHGRSGTTPGGDVRGAKAVDFQNTRDAASQVAAGARSFIAAGQNNRASGADSSAQGYETWSDGAASHAEGRETQVLSDAAHAEGRGTKIDAFAEAGHAEGWESEVHSVAAHAEGRKTKVDASADAGHAEGEETLVQSEAGHAEGYKTKVGSFAEPAPCWPIAPIPAVVLQLQKRPRLVN